MTDIKAKITKEGGFKLFYMGETKTFKKGEEVTGHVAKRAIANGAGTQTGGAKIGPRKSKSKGAAPENKEG